MKRKRLSFSLTRFLKSFHNYRLFYSLSPDERNIVFYSESSQDWHVFKPIIERLLSTSKNVCYVTSDTTDDGLALKHEQYHPFFIGEGFWQILFFQFLKADCLILTMIDLNIFHLKRSIYPVHYIYLFHSMGSTHMVDFENSYDHYDTILCTGPHQIREIRKREELYHLPAKNLIPHGYARIEELMAEATKRPHNPSYPPFVLLAPTWGENSILNLCGRKLISVLLGANYRLILRPHYQTYKLTPHIVEELLELYGDNPLFSYVNRMGETESLFKSDILICDWSSTSIEYALGLGKPVLYIDVPRRVRNHKYMELGLDPLEVTIRHEVGEVLSPDEIGRAPEMIESLLADRKKFTDRITALREKVLFNIGRSVEVGAEAIAGIADSMRQKRLHETKIRH